MNYLRKKLQAIMASADFKGYLREVTGTDSVTLTDCMGSDMTSLSLVGNAVQDGTPSPETPVEVQGCGDRTGNLFDIANLNLCMMSTSSIDYTPKVENGIFYSGGQSGEASGQFPYIEIGDAETVTISFTVSGEAPSGYIYGFDSVDDDGVVIGNVIINNFSNSLGTITFTYTGAKQYIGICAFSQNRYGVALSNIQIIKGSYTADTMPPYEPYGYKVPVEVGGVNLFDVSRYTGFDGNSVTITNTSGKTWQGRAFNIDYAVEFGKTYTYSVDYVIDNVADYSTIRFGYIRANAGSIMTIGDIIAIHGSGTFVHTVTVPESIDDFDYFALYANSSGGNPAVGDKITISNIQIVEGSYTADTMPAYEPYHEPQTVNVYTDKPLYGQDGEAWSEVVYDGTENWYTNGTSDDDTLVRYFLVSQTKTGVAGPRKCVCTHYPKTTHNVTDWWEQDTCQAYGFTSQKGWFSICVNFADYPTVGSWEAFLQAQYAAGTPLKAYFATEESAPAETTAPTYKGTTIISADTTIQPSSMTAKYYATKKED